MNYYWHYETKVGNFIMTCDDKALNGLWIENRNRFDFKPLKNAVEKQTNIFKKVILWIDDYLAGNNPKINVDLQPKGTHFQEEVWEELKKIPYGTTVSYGDIAKRIAVKNGRRVCAQAVGQAVGHNPIIIMIPCHRVLGSDGSLTGYGGGIDLKKYLLELENKSSALTCKVIAHIENDYTSKFGIPRQSGLVRSVLSKIVFEKEYRDVHAFRGLEGYSHLWIIWEFSKARREDWSPTVLPPRLGGKTRMGVFATRSPFRPNPLGLTLVELEKIDFDSKDGPTLYVRGADLLNGTPIYDIKPYLPYVESVPNAKGGFSDAVKDKELKVNLPDDILGEIPDNLRKPVVELLGQDPRPAYKNEEDRVYGMEFAGFDFRFTVKGEVLTVVEVVRLKDNE